MLTNKQEVAFFSTLGGILLIFLVLIYIFGHKSLAVDTAALDAGIPPTIENVSLEAKAAFVYDTYTKKVLYAKNETARLPLASLTKAMSALVATNIAPAYSTVVISREAVKTDGDAGLFSGERWGLKDLLDYTLVSSANDGVRAIALALGSLDSSTTSSQIIVSDFVAKMNATADSLGLKNTYYLNETGLDETLTQSGAYGSAEDQAVLFVYILKNYPTLLTATRESSITVISLDGIAHTARNTNTIVSEIPGLLASKTGYTDLAGGNLVVAFDPGIGRPIIISILGSSEEGRFSDMQKLVSASLESIENSVVLKK